MIVVPYTILVDSGEQHPYRFLSMAGDARQRFQPMVIATKTTYLGVGKGDYTADFCRERLHIERKSAEDCYGTVLGFGSAGQTDRTRRERFEAELEWLASIEFGAVVVESSLDDLLANPPDYGKQSPHIKRKILFRSILAFQLKHPKVQWMFASRRICEHWTFRVINRLWEEENGDIKC